MGIRQECMDTKWVSSRGPFVARFECMVANCLGTRPAVATVNGATALVVALLVAGVLPEDKLLVPTFTWL